MLKADDAYLSRNHSSTSPTFESETGNGSSSGTGGGAVRSRQPHGLPWLSTVLGEPTVLCGTVLEPTGGSTVSTPAVAPMAPGCTVLKSPTVALTGTVDEVAPSPC